MLGLGLGQTLTVEKRPHPYGEKGVRLSLDEVAKRVKEGFQHPAVVTWASECIQRAAKEEGFRANNDHDRASVLLRAVQRKLWLPDPVGTEWMAAAHLMACDKSTADQLCIIPKNCDDRVVIWGAACMSVGIHFMVVGHSYNDQQAIEHVLGVVRLGRKPDDKWLYGDPSTDDWPLGKCLPPKRERLISLPDMKVRCDETACLWKKDPKQWDPEKSGFVTTGTFVGVSGLPEERPTFMWLPTESEANQFLGVRGFSWLGYDVTGSDSDCYKQGETRDRVVACSGEAGGKAATAACLATPGMQGFAPVCNEIGKYVAESIAGPVYDGAKATFEAIFGGPEGTSPTQAQASGAWAVQGALNSYNRAVSALQHAYARTIAPILRKADPSVPSALSPEAARQYLDYCGAKSFVQQTIQSNKPVGLYPAYAIKCWFKEPNWWQPGKPLGMLNNSCGFILADSAADLWRTQSIGPALGCALQKLTNTAAKAQAVAEANNPNWMHMRETNSSSSTKKTSYFWPVAGTLGLGGLIWWATKPLGK